MSLSDRRTFLALLAAAPLAACGFTPVYGPGGAGNVLRNRIQIAAPDTRLAFQLVARFEERLGRADTPDYMLVYDLETSARGIAVTGTDNITRINLTGTLAYRVTEAGSNLQVAAGQISTFSAYSTTGTPVATASAERDAEDRLMTALADQLVSRLLSSAGRWT